MDKGSIVISTLNESNKINPPPGISAIIGDMFKFPVVILCQVLSVLIISGFADASVTTALYLAGLPIVYGHIAGFVAMLLTCFALCPDTFDQLTSGRSSGGAGKIAFPVLFFAFMSLRSYILLTLTHMGQSAFLSSVFITDGIIFLLYLAGRHFLKREISDYRKANVV